jgi:hypothetical protein
VLLAGGAYAASSWVDGLNGGSTAASQSANVSNLTLSAVAAPSALNELFPGADGDVVVTITNPNSFPVTVTAFNLPSNSTYANGYTTSSMTTLQAGCGSSTPSGVTWNFSSSVSDSVHTLISPVTVGPIGGSSSSLTLTLGGAALMTLSTPSACESTFFAMPPLTGVVAAASNAAPTASPATDGWSG